MTEQGFKRKLTAILSADVVGYSRLMGEDDDATVRTLSGHRKMMSSLIEQHVGRVVDSPGDNMLAEFSSVLQAVNCAVDIQRELAERNAELPENRRMVYRIGINLGDVIVEDERIYGDGVNIAARLESLAEPGGICISGFVYNQVKNRLKLEYEYLGEKSVKNIRESVPVYRVLSFPGAAAHRVIKAKKKVERSWRKRVIIAAAILAAIAAALVLWWFYAGAPSMERASVDKMAFPLPEKPSIAVLPFTNMTGDPNQEYIGDGISESIIGSLSKVSRMFVIARNSTFTYKGKPVKVQQVAEDLGIRYVLEGSVQRSKDRLRVTAQLIDALTGHHLWSEKYDRKMGELFDLQDELTKKIVVALQVELTDGEQASIIARSTDNLEAWSYVVRGYNLAMKLNAKDNAKSRELFNAAIKLDPKCVYALDGLAFTHNADIFFGWSDSPVDSMTQTYDAVQKALALDDNDAQAHGCMGTIYLFMGEHEMAMTEGKKAISLDPNSYVGYAGLAITEYYSGHFQEAVDLMKKAMRISPYYPAWFLQYLGFIYTEMGRYDEAIATFNHLGERCKNGEGSLWWAPASLAYVYMKLGREKEARALVAEALKIEPGLSSAFIRRQPFKDPDHLARILEIYKKAGLP